MEWPCGKCKNPNKELYYVDCECDKKREYKRLLRECTDCKKKDKTIEIMAETIDKLQRKLEWYEKILYGKGDKY
jgi:DNA-binding transcriptional regulator GbsR (MarR family)